MSDKNDVSEISDDNSSFENIIATHNIISKTHPINLRGAKNPCEFELILDKTLNFILLKIVEENSKNEINRLLITYSDIYLLFNNYFICFNENMGKIYNFFNNCFSLKKYVIKIMNDKKVSLEFLILQDKKSIIKNIIIPPYLTEEDKKEFNKRLNIFQKFETNGSNEPKIFMDEIIAPQPESVKYNDEKFLLNISLSTFPNIRTMIFTLKYKILEENQNTNSDTDSTSSNNIHIHINNNIHNNSSNDFNNTSNNFIFNNNDNNDNNDNVNNNKKKENEKIFNAYFTYDDLIEISKNYYSVFANIDDIKDDILINLYNKNYKIEEISEKIIKLYVTTIMYTSSVVNEKEVIFDIIQDYKIENWYQKKMEKYQNLLNDYKMQLFLKANEKKNNNNNNSNNNAVNNNSNNNKKNKKEKNQNPSSDIILPINNKKITENKKKSKINVSKKKKLLSKKRKARNKLSLPKTNNKNYNLRNDQKEQNSLSEIKINKSKILGSRRCKSIVRRHDLLETSIKSNNNNNNSVSKKYNLRDRKKDVLNNKENVSKSSKEIENKKTNSTKEVNKKKKIKKKSKNQKKKKKKKVDNDNDENKKIVEYCEVIDLEESIEDKAEAFKKENIEY